MILSLIKTQCRRCGSRYDRKSRNWSGRTKGRTIPKFCIEYKMIADFDEEYEKGKQESICNSCYQQVKSK